MIWSRVAAAALLALAVAFGASVHLALGNHRTRPHAAIPPTAVRPPFTLPGTIVVAQRGAIYRLTGGVFTRAGLPAGSWSQPAALPGGGIVAVNREAQSSDIYRVDLATGQATRLTQSAAGVLQENHWNFYPAATADGALIFYSTDSPKIGYRVDFSIWSREIGGGAPPQRWTEPNPYTGGDVSAVPLPGGGLIYSEFAFDPQGHVYSQIWIQRRPLETGEALTTPADDCRQPALSPDGGRLLMICTGGAQTGRVEMAAFDGTRLGPLEALVDGTLASAPTWSPDGHSLVYLAPAASGPGFQLFWFPLDADALGGTRSDLTSPSPSAPAFAVRRARQLTTDLDLDGTSSIAWMA